MHRILAALALVALPCFAACHSTGAENGERDYTLVFLKKGPNNGKLSAEANKQAFAGHFSNMERLAEERKLVVAGPFGEVRHDPALSGLFILDTSKRKEARAWAETDPTMQAGVFVMEYHDLATDAPLSASLERALKVQADARAAGRTPAPGEGARRYVLLTAEDEKRARDQLEPLRGSGGVFLIGRLDRARAFALLDAESVEAARQRFAAQLGKLGSHELDAWFATEELARMYDPSPR